MNYCHKKLENFKFKNKSFHKVLEIGAECSALQL